MATKEKRGKNPPAPDLHRCRARVFAVMLTLKDAKLLTEINWLS